MFNYHRKTFAAICLTCLSLTSACQQVGDLAKSTVSPSSLRDVPAQRFGYRYEADVDAPPPSASETQLNQEKLSIIQTDFDKNRPLDALQTTIASPDRQRILAIYQRPEDEKSTFRLDLYDANGKLLRAITPQGLALVFTQTVAWSPDGNSIAFVGLRRLVEGNPEAEIAPTPPAIEESPTPIANANDANANNAAPETSPTIVPTPQQSVSPTPNAATVLTFITEQIYICNRDGGDLKPLTLKEGLIYFYFTWSPDSSMLAALACKQTEWISREANLSRVGRPRIIEKSGRERLLDDNLTDILPVFSPDSSKVATAFQYDVHIYDTISSVPTSAKIPLIVPFQTSSQIFDAKQGQQSNAPANNAQMQENIANNATATTTQNVQPSASFRPIVALRWTEDKTLSLQTAFVSNYGAENIQSFERWHRLNFSPQPVVLK
ncbi:MAG: PD40 domain-containing protein [Pyrinomonadaceae bacterium]|nr:PD40 domain-containing protein [Pyrinomonadaceae bacterium]